MALRKTGRAQLANRDGVVTTDPAGHPDVIALSSLASAIGAGDVSAAAVITDNVLVRGDGGAKGIQGSLVTLDDTGAFGLPDGVRQIFNPDATKAGLNVGAQAGDPSAPVNGDLWYDSTANELTARINGVNVALGEPVMRSVRVTLTAAQVKALFTTPITLVAALGAGIGCIVERVTFASTFGTAAYAGANALEFRYTNAAGAKVTADISAATLNFAAGTKISAVAGVTTELIAVANSPIVVCVPVANPTLGDSPVTFTVLYTGAFV